jgi:hypothetical protein
VISGGRGMGAPVSLGPYGSSVVVEGVVSEIAERWGCVWLVQ